MKEMKIILFHMTFVLVKVFTCRREFGSGDGEVGQDPSLLVLAPCRLLLNSLDITETKYRQSYSITQLSGETAERRTMHMRLLSRTPLKSWEQLLSPSKRGIRLGDKTNNAKEVDGV